MPLDACVPISTVFSMALAAIAVDGDGETYGRGKQGRACRIKTGGRALQ